MARSRSKQQSRNGSAQGTSAQGHAQSRNGSARSTGAQGHVQSRNGSTRSTSAQGYAQSRNGSTQDTSAQGHMQSRNGSARSTGAQGHGQGPKRGKRRRMRLNGRGKLLFGGFAVILLIVACLCLLRCANRKQGNGDAPIEDAENGTETAPLDASPTLALTASPLPTLAPTDAPQFAATGARLPTAEEEAGAVDGVIRTSNVVLRKGAGKSFDVIKKYDVGVRVRVFAMEDGYYLVRVIDDTRYGFMSTEFITKFGLLPYETAATPVPAPLAGTIMGIVNVDEVSLRSIPSTQHNDPLGVCKREETVWVFFQTGEFYYVQCASTGKRGYVFAEYVMTQADVPSATPVP